MVDSILKATKTIKSKEFRAINESNNQLKIIKNNVGIGGICGNLCELWIFVGIVGHRG